MKTASKILGGCVVALLIFVIIFTFIGARSLLNEPPSENNGDIGDILVDGFSVISLFIGYVGYVIINTFGAVLIVYLICFCISYIKLFKGKSNIYFLKYSAVTVGVILVFETVIFALNPQSGWKLFLIVLLAAVLFIAYATVAIKYLKVAEANETVIPDSFDEAPQLVYYDKDDGNE